MIDKIFVCEMITLSILLSVRYTKSGRVEVFKINLHWLEKKSLNKEAFSAQPRINLQLYNIFGGGYFWSSGFIHNATNNLPIVFRGSVRVV